VVAVAGIAVRVPRRATRAPVSTAATAASNQSPLQMSLNFRPPSHLHLSEIGIPFNTDFSIAFGTRQSLHVFKEMQKIQDHSVRVQMVSGRLSFQPKSTFTLAFGVYEIITRYGDPSSYGAVYKIAKQNDPEKRLFIMKAQPVSRHESIQVLYELAIQHFLFETTKMNPCVPQIHWVGKLQPVNAPEIYLFSIQEFIAGGTLMQYCVDNQISRGRKFEMLQPIFVSLARYLAPLWSLYKFNHCDLHASNVMLHGGIPYLVDFGFSVLNYGDFVLSTRGHMQKEGRDLTHLLTYLVASKSIDIGEPFVARVLGETYSFFTQQDSEHPHFMTQYYFDQPGFDNPGAFPETILDEYGALTPIPNRSLLPQIQNSIRQEYNTLFPSESNIPTGYLYGALGFAALAAIQFARRGGSARTSTKQKMKTQKQKRKYGKKHVRTHRNKRRILSHKRRITSV